MIELIRIVRFFPKPDLTFFLEGDIDLFYSRMTNSEDKAISMTYYIKIMNYYKIIAETQKFIKIEASLNKDEIHDIIYQYSIQSYKKM